MRTLIFAGIMGFALPAYASGIDYSYCELAFNVPEQFQGSKKDFPL